VRGKGYKRKWVRYMDTPNAGQGDNYDVRLGHEIIQRRRWVNDKRNKRKTYLKNGV
jgi:hypothetical protein